MFSRINHYGYDINPEFLIETEFEANENFNSYAFIPVFIYRHGNPVNYGEAYTYVEELRTDDGRLNPVPISPRFPYHEHGSVSSIDFKLSSIHTITASYIILLVTPRKKGDWFMRIRLGLMALPKDSLNAVLGALQLSQKFAGSYKKKISSLLKIVRPSPDYLFLGAVISIDIGSGQIWGFPNAFFKNKNRVGV